MLNSYSFGVLQAFEAYDTAKDHRAVDCLKYMCLTKVLGDNAADVPSILSNKVSVYFQGFSMVDFFSFNFPCNL
jgi:hypothetical protein